MDLKWKTRVFSGGGVMIWDLRNKKGGTKRRCMSGVDMVF